MNRFVDWLIRRAERRGPDFVIGGHERPYLLRWRLLPRNPVFNVYLHQFLRSDDDRALHDHPWLFNVSLLLRGPYIEWVPAGDNTRRPEPRFLKAGDCKFRDWWAVLDVDRATVTREGVKEAYRRAASRHHPDKPGGSHEAMAELNAAQELALKEVTR